MKKIKTKRKNKKTVIFRMTNAQIEAFERDYWVRYNRA